MTVGQSIGLEVNADDIVELFEDHSIEVNTEEIEHLQNVQEKSCLIKLNKNKRIKKMYLVL